MLTSATPSFDELWLEAERIRGLLRKKGDLVLWCRVGTEKLPAAFVVGYANYDDFVPLAEGPTSLQALQAYVAELSVELEARRKSVQAELDALR